MCAPDTPRSPQKKFRGESATILAHSGCFPSAARHAPSPCARGVVRQHTRATRRKKSAGADAGYRLSRVGLWREAGGACSCWADPSECTLTPSSRGDHEQRQRARARLHGRRMYATAKRMNAESAPAHKMSVHCCRSRQVYIGSIFLLVRCNVCGVCQNGIGLYRRDSDRLRS